MYKFSPKVLNEGSNRGSQCNAGPGYDLVTGVGTFKANVLVNSMVAATH